MIPVADTTHKNASQDYAALRQEAVRLARRILTDLDSDTEPAGVHWGHVGDMATVRRALRDVNDQMFGEGEHGHGAIRDEDNPGFWTTTAAECDAEMLRLTRGERGCCNPAEHRA